jgi:hypothetical protein
MVEDAVKDEPLAVRVNPTPPAVVEVGEREERTGVGLKIFAVVVGWVKE